MAEDVAEGAAHPACPRAPHSQRGCQHVRLHAPTLYAPTPSLAGKFPSPPLTSTACVAGVFTVEETAAAAREAELQDVLGVSGLPAAEGGKGGKGGKRGRGRARARPQKVAIAAQQEGPVGAEAEEEPPHVLMSWGDTIIDFGQVEDGAGEPSPHAGGDEPEKMDVYDRMMNGV